MSSDYSFPEKQNTNKKSNFQTRIILLDDYRSMHFYMLLLFALNVSAFEDYAALFRYDHKSTLLWASFPIQSNLVIKDQLPPNY